MQVPLLVILIVIAAYFLYLQLVFVTYIIGFIIIADASTGFVSRIFGGIGAVFRGGKAAIKTEGEEMSKANPKMPSGKKFIGEGFSRIGKSLGEGEKARMEGRKIEDKRDFFAITGQASGDFLEGIMKLFKR